MWKTNFDDHRTELLVVWVKVVLYASVSTLVRTDRPRLDLLRRKTTNIGRRTWNWVRTLDLWLRGQSGPQVVNGGPCLTPGFRIHPPRYNGHRGWVQRVLPLSQLYILMLFVGTERFFDFMYVCLSVISIVYWN